MRDGFALVQKELEATLFRDQRVIAFDRSAAADVADRVYYGRRHIDCEPGLRLLYHRVGPQRSSTQAKRSSRKSSLTSVPSQFRSLPVGRWCA
jgi:hypothetical protein